MFHDIYEAYRVKAEVAIDESLPLSAEPESRVVEAARYSLLGGGKRFRPVLVLAVGAMFGLPEDELVPYACAMEMIHTYSLIHDDLPCMDNDDLRRGRPTCHRQFDEATAVLAGDALLNTAFETLFSACLRMTSPVPVYARIRAAARIAKSSGIQGMVGGQAIDMRYEGEFADDPTLERLHRMKTGALIEAAVLAPADLAQAGPTVLAALSRYAAGLGLAFQIRDDLLDATSSTELLGKTAGKDARDGKTTYVTRYGIDKSRCLLRETVAGACAALEVPAGSGLDTAFLNELARQLLEGNS